MRALHVTQPGGPAALTLTEIPEPTALPGHAVVRNEAVGLNFIDVYYRNGTYPAAYPLVPGQEAAGVVTAVGEGVEGIAPGDRVAYATQLGAYAEYTAVPAGKLVPVPDSVSLQDAAAVLLQGLAAHYLSHTTHPVAPGESVVVLAAAGGLGRTLVQLAAHRGATVVAVASGKEKQQVALAAGAHHAVGYEDFADAVRDLTGGQGAHVVYDSVGAATFATSLQALRRRGTLVVCGLSSGPVPPFDLELLRTSGSLHLTRPTLADHVPDADSLRAAAAELFAYVARGVVRPDVRAELPLAEAARAHALLEGRATTGKVLLTP
ncbi:quinone oxidoreductase family protein [Streptomyces subrutilus]|uniref:Quinone oxidoreductase n=1 Tax=Streptomyces subrutilus TaxID=36818 RepID=A0A5P2UFY0_9ACTN|nr:quinone oxidoreductase [Streptomyces subrutilus]QEU77365.1 quinone oxidoreductase [Streptomyces subrutilus]WSJ33558.1 quinone oxidoreductase [Streptomyces subrutilus]GGZ46873.1 quinone oxidoreductase [Streptomyces subrutilus]